METIQNFADWQDVICEAEDLVAEGKVTGEYDGEKMHLLIERIANIPTDKVCIKFFPVCPYCKKEILN